MFALLPMPYRILIGIGMLVAVWALGDIHGHTAEGEAKDVVIAQQQHAFDDRIHTADVALAAANDRAATKTGTAADDLATAQQKAYKQGVEDAKHNQAEGVRVAGLAAGRERVRVDAICRTTNTGGSRQLPNDPSPSAGSDGAATTTAELSTGAAGRIGAVGKAADDEVAALRRRLALAQDYARVAYETCGPQATPPAPPAPKPLPRTVIKLGAPNPFDK